MVLSVRFRGVGVGVRRFDTVSVAFYDTDLVWFRLVIEFWVDLCLFMVIDGCVVTLIMIGECVWKICVVTVRNCVAVCVFLV